MLLECVPNISEGRNRKVIDKIVNKISGVPGVTFLHLDVSADANRSVLTYVGESEALIEAGFALIEECYNLIDMSIHTGTHPRIGSVDVLPFIPLDCYLNTAILGNSPKLNIHNDLSEEEGILHSVNCALELAELIQNDLNLPVYLYEFAQENLYRKSLPDIRRGEYEGLSDKLLSSDWSPDFGPSVFNPKFGATVIGVRKPLIAYNINIDAKGDKIPREIAKKIRQTRDEGETAEIRAIGWYQEEDSQAQVSLNLLDHRIFSLKSAYDLVSSISQELDAKITGSEIVGMILSEALKCELSENELIEHLGLDTFNPNEQIIENMILKCIK